MVHDITLRGIKLGYTWPATIWAQVELQLGLRSRCHKPFLGKVRPRQWEYSQLLCCFHIVLVTNWPPHTMKLPKYSPIKCHCWGNGCGTVGVIVIYEIVHRSVLQTHPHYISKISTHGIVKKRAESRKKRRRWGFAIGTVDALYCFNWIIPDLFLDYFQSLRAIFTQSIL